MVLFKAVKGSDEELANHITERPDIVWSAHSGELSLGRSVSSIADRCVPRKVCVIDVVTQTIRGYRDDSVYSVNNVPMKGMFARKLADGATIGFGPNYRYRYIVYYSGQPPSSIDLNRSNNNKATDETSGSNKKRPRETPLSPAKLGPRQVSKAAEEFSCVCCLEVMVQATSLVPCGHSFCQSCCMHRECPTCRVAVTGKLPCRALDNAIASLIQEEPGFFEASDVEAYINRTKDDVLTTRRRRRRRNLQKAALNTPSSSGTNHGSSNHNHSSGEPEVICIE